MLQDVDNYLTDMGYVTGPNLSIVDIMLYFEIYTICVMYRREIPTRFKKLKNWYNLLTTQEALIKMNT